MSFFTNARIVGYAPNPGDYELENAPRGTPAYVMRSHAITEFRRNPRRWVLGYQSPESKAKQYGQLLDCLALTPYTWPKRYCVLPGDAPRRPSQRQRDAKKPSPETLASIEWWDTWEEEHGDNEVVDSETNGAVHAAVARLAGVPEIADLIQSGKKQCWVAADYQDRATGLTVAVKGLVDIVPEIEHPIYGSCLADLKTTRNASPRSFARDCYQYGYHIAAAVYLDLMEAATGWHRSDFVHIVQESFPPYECRMPYLGQQFIDLGRLTYQSALAQYCRCVASGQWPSYDPPGTPITQPEVWMLDLASVLPELEEVDEPEEMPAEVTP